jgi:dehypoxanthine futalosine cyclase
MLKQPDQVDDILRSVQSGEIPTRDDIIFMYDEADLNSLGQAARILAQEKSGNTVSFVSNMILNYTNICNVRCNFCAFYRTGTESDAFLLTKEQVITEIEPYYRNFHITQLLIQGGVNPALPLEYYTDLFRSIHEAYPDLGIHGLSTSEISFIARKEHTSVADIIKSLVEAGMQSIPGAGAEIFDDEVRKVLGRPKGSGKQWLEVMETAHRLGVHSSATMMFGHVEESRHKADHLLALVDLQSKYNGFLSFTPWNFEPGNTQLQKSGTVMYRVGGADVLRNIAISRIVLNNSIPTIQSSWLTNGIQMGQMSVLFGANDWGGTIYDEKVIPATGKQVGNLRKDAIINGLNQIGMEAVERDNLYRVIGHYQA